jgi:hypothetical protein
MVTEPRIIGQTAPCTEPDADRTDPSRTPEPLPPEFGGRDGPDPTRYGDWEKNGRCIDF